MWLRHSRISKPSCKNNTSPFEEVTPNENELVILTYNVDCDSSSAKVMDAIMMSKADIICLVENNSYRETQFNQNENLKSAYPYQYWFPPRVCGPEGIAILSKHTIVLHELLNNALRVPGSWFPQWIGIFELQNKKHRYVQISTVHLRPPLAELGYQWTLRSPFQTNYVRTEECKYVYSQLLNQRLALINFIYNHKNNNNNNNAFCYDDGDNNNIIEIFHNDEDDEYDDDKSNDHRINNNNNDNRKSDNVGNYNNNNVWKRYNYHFAYPPNLPFETKYPGQPPYELNPEIHDVDPNRPDKSFEDIKNTNDINVALKAASSIDEIFKMGLFIVGDFNENDSGPTLDFLQSSSSLSKLVKSSIIPFSPHIRINGGFSAEDNGDDDDYDGSNDGGNDDHHVKGGNGIYAWISQLTKLKNAVSEKIDRSIETHRFPVKADGSYILRSRLDHLLYSTSHFKCNFCRVIPGFEEGASDHMPVLGVFEWK